MKYPDFYRLYDLENAFDKIRPLPVHKYSNYVNRVPKLNSITFDILKPINEVVSILSTLTYEMIDSTYGVFRVVWKAPQTTLCFITKELIGIKWEYEIYCVNDLPSFLVTVPLYNTLVFSSYDSKNKLGEIVGEKGWQPLKYSNKCYFLKDKSSIDVEFCFFEYSATIPQTYKNANLNKILGTDCGLLVEEDGEYSNYSTGLMISPYKRADSTVYIDEGLQKIVLDETITAPLKLTLTQPALTDDLLGKVVSDLQKDISIGFNIIYGTSKYVTGYTGFSGDPTQQEGNYLALKAEASVEDAVITAKVIGGIGDYVTLDSDRIIIFRLVSTATAVEFNVIDGLNVLKYTYSLSGLQREEEPVAELTPFTSGEVSSPIKFNTSLSVEEVTSILSQLTYESDPSYQEGTINLIDVVGELEDNGVLYATKYPEAEGVYFLSACHYNTGTSYVVWSSVAIPEQEITEGFQNLGEGGTFNVNWNIAENGINQGAIWNTGELVGTDA